MSKIAELCGTHWPYVY